MCLLNFKVASFAHVICSLQLLRPGGVLVVDNVLWYGKVSDGDATDATTSALRQFNDFVVQDERVSMTLIPVGDGLILCRKL